MTFAQRNAPWNEGSLRALLTTQYGLVTAKQWGASPAALTRAVQRGELERVLPRVYRSTLVPPSLHQRALAAVLWAGSSAVASHSTAARLWGLRDVPDGLHVWSPTGRGSCLQVVAHRGLVTGNDRRLHDRIPITSPARTLVDLAGMLAEEDLEAAMEELLHRGTTTPLAIGRCLELSEA